MVRIFQKRGPKLYFSEVCDSSSIIMTLYHGPWGTPGCVGNGRGHIKSPMALYPRALLGPESSILMESRSYNIILNSYSVFSLLVQVYSQRPLLSTACPLRALQALLVALHAYSLPEHSKASLTQSSLSHSSTTSNTGSEPPPVSNACTAKRCVPAHVSA